MRNLRSHPTQRRDHYQELTDRIVAALEAGVAPWRRPWDPNACGASTTPVNVATGHRYRGVNLFVLGMSPPRLCERRSALVQLRQAAARGWQVRKARRRRLFISTSRSRSRTKPLIGAARRAAFRCCERSRFFMLRKLMASLPLRPQLRRRRSPSALRTSSSSLRRAACRFGSVVNAPFTAPCSTSFKCLPTKPFTVPNNGPASSCTSLLTRAAIPRD